MGRDGRGKREILGGRGLLALRPALGPGGAETGDVRGATGRVAVIGRGVGTFGVVGTWCPTGTHGERAPLPNSRCQCRVGSSSPTGISANVGD